MFRSPIFLKYLLPGFVFQSIVIGGGYGTGRELVEFFLNDGPAAGYYGIVVSATIWSIVLAISFELARLQRSYDYRSFINKLLGKAWIGYEIVYVTGMILVVSVLGSAAGELTEEVFGIPSIVGIITMIVVVGILVFYGTPLIEKALSIWSFALYGVFLVLIIVAVNMFGAAIGENIGGEHSSASSQGAHWWLSGARYAAYNVGIMPAMLFATRHIVSRKEALVSGSIAGLLAMLPGVMIYTAMLGQYPEILSTSIPADFLLGQMNIPVLRLVFQIILFGTLIETGIGLIHGFNERVNGVYEEKGKSMPRVLRFGIAIFILVLAVFLANAIGIVDLIASGYGALTWGYWIVFVLPVLTLGLWRVLKAVLKPF
ncbi:MAG: hypothetical protein BMS9Abin05_0146 [Rhodothermia bacterium]|nr:MAG: hypothetical protein BMS9Abin05_0146 [Rhodothermia bacterium]